MEPSEILDQGQHPLVPEPVASQGTRFGNYVLDAIVLYVVSIPIGYLPFMQSAKQIFMNQMEEAKSTNDISAIMDATLHYVWISLLVSITLSLLYYIAMEHTVGKTLGKMITKTKVVSADGSHPTLGAIVIRNLCRYIPFEPFSFLFGPIGWHDRISNTRVVADKPIVGVGY